MSTPRFYSWDDDGSPGRALSGNLQNRLKQILVPCLVTGYGDKPGAGWTIGHEHENGFSLLNADGNVINFVSGFSAPPHPVMDGHTIHVYAAESLINGDGPIINGANLCSGTYRKGVPELANYPRHSIGRAAYILINNLPTLQWTIVADSKTFTLNCSTQQSIDANITGHSFSIYTGNILSDIDVSGNFLALGGDILPYNGAGVMFAYCRGYSSPINITTGLASHAVVGAQPYASNAGLYVTEKLESFSRNINLQQPRVTFGDSYVGRLRGVVYDDLLRSLYGWEVHLKALGFSGIDFTDRGKLVNIDGHNYAFARSYSGGSILTDNPAFW